MNEDIRMECLRIAAMGREGWGPADILRIAASFLSFVETGSYMTSSDQQAAPAPAPNVGLSAGDQLHG